VPDVVMPVKKRCGVMEGQSWCGLSGGRVAISAEQHDQGFEQQGQQILRGGDNRV
jgi:hypothetical protein